MSEILSRFIFADMLLQYQQDTAKNVGILLIPVHLEQDIAIKRKDLSALGEHETLPDVWKYIPASSVEPLIQIKCIGDAYPGSSQGNSMKNSRTLKNLHYVSQNIEESGDFVNVVTSFTNGHGLSCEHILKWYSGQSYFSTETRLKNISNKSFTVEMVTSFNIGGITPFDAADASGQIFVHRFKSFWSAEGKHEIRSIDDLHLERAWISGVPKNERFGQVGSFPVKNFFPFIAIEDRKKNVFWGAQLAWSGSWQMEIHRKDDSVSISGGLADREMGHWLKKIAPGEEFLTPLAYLTVVQGDIDCLCDRLLAAQACSLYKKPEIENDLPIVFNEYCCSWGRPTEQSMVSILEKLKGSEVKYVVIDAGWYSDDQWCNAHGDWIPSKKRFPSSLKSFTEKARMMGFVPGIWFELETVGDLAQCYNFDEHFLKRDGVVLQSGTRKFWDFRDSYTFDYLTERVIRFLRDNDFGYLKTDYNDTIGIGVDGAESLGEGLRQHIEGVHRFFKMIKEQLPELVIEICASGGHRLEPSMMALGNMANYSDAGEIISIPIIAANVQRLILPRQSQIMAVVRKKDNFRRISYNIAAAFLGRMCLSGDICELDEQQWSFVRKAMQYYQKIMHIIENGRSFRFGPEIISYNYPNGWQGILRVHSDSKEALLVMHSFAELIPSSIEINLMQTGWRIDSVFSGSNIKAKIIGDKLKCRFDGAFDSGVFYLTHR